MRNDQGVLGGDLLLVLREFAFRDQVFEIDFAVLEGSFFGPSKRHWLSFFVFHLLGQRKANVAESFEAGEVDVRKEGT